MAHVQPVSMNQEQIARTALENAIGSPGEAGQGVLEVLRSLVFQQDQ